MKQAKVFLNNMLTGILTEDDSGYEFRYDSDYLKSDGAVAISLTMQLTDKPYHSNVMFPFFDGLSIHKPTISKIDSTICKVFIS